jgi:hypothetical protein
LKGCAFRALLSLLGLAASIAAIGGALHYRYGTRPSDAIGVSIFAGPFGWLAVNLLMAAVKAWRERAALRAGVAGTPPVDGTQTILVGHIEPVGTTLRAPLSGRECVAYTFEIYEMRLVGKSRSKVVYCDGIALTPSMIITRAGSFRLLAVPELDCDETDLNRETALARAAEQMRTITFEPPPAPFSRPAIEQQWNDDDGAYRRERRHVQDEVDLAKCKLSERHLERGARVCVFGQYSASKRAIVTDPHDWSKITRVMKGDADAIVTQLGASIVRRLLGALVCAGAATGLVAAFVANFS